MKLALYVHDLRLEVGHSNSLIELIRNLPPAVSDKITHVEVINYTCMNPNELFPNLKLKVKRVRVPCGWLKPFLLKSIFYQVWTFVYNRVFQDKDVLKIGIGVCCLDVNAISIQFIHKQWTKMGLEMEKGFALRLIYKKILFYYFEWCEDFLFNRSGIKLFSPAKFLTTHVQESYPKSKTATIYSGVNLERFKIDSQSKDQILNSLKQDYPELSTLDVKQPIFIFVGAYERKGIDEALNLVKQRPGSQFIVVGSPSIGRSPSWPKELKIFSIRFTKRIKDFYSLADVFIFPTLYEPFGLVIFEAMCMGLTVITRREGVGASELLEGLPEVIFLDIEKVDLGAIKVKSYQDKLGLRENRLKQLGDVSWSKAGAELGEFLFQSLR